MAMSVITTESDHIKDLRTGNGIPLTYTYPVLLKIARSSTTYYIYANGQKASPNRTNGSYMPTAGTDIPKALRSGPTYIQRSQ